MGIQPINESYPRMITGYRHYNGRQLRYTRISNTTHIGCPEKFDVGDHVFIGHYNFIDCCNGLKLEEGCQVTNYVSILTHSSHQSIRLYGNQYVHNKDLKGYVKGSVQIGAYTFIGPHAVIMPGARIGKGCLISAFSFVKGEFQDFAIVGGNPAIVIGDTRKADEEWLTKHPELRSYYQQWAAAK